MKKLLLIPVVVLVIGACAPSTALPHTLPDTSSAVATPTPPILIQNLDAQGTAQAAIAQVTAAFRTEVAVTEIARVVQATQVAGTQQAVEATNASVQATANTIAHAEATRAMAATEANNANIAAITQVYMTQVSANATSVYQVTATAVADAERQRQLDLEQEARDRARAEWWDRVFYSVGSLLEQVISATIIGFAIVAAAFVLIGLGGGAWLAIGLINARRRMAEYTANKMRLLRSPDGRLYDYDAKAQKFFPVIDVTPSLPGGGRPLDDLPLADTTLTGGRGPGEVDPEEVEGVDVIEPEPMLRLNHGARVIPRHATPAEERKARSELQLARRLIRDALIYQKHHDAQVNATGVGTPWHPRQIPGYRKLNEALGEKSLWSGSRWSKAKAAIAHHTEGSTSGPGGGTYLKEKHGSLAEFYERLVRNNNVWFI